MSHDMPANRLLVRRKRHRIRRAHHLIRDPHSHVKLLCELGKRAQELVKLLLPWRELSAPSEVNAEESSRRVDHEQRKPVRRHPRGDMVQEFALMLTRVRTSHQNVVEHVVRVEVEPRADLHDALRPKCVLCIDKRHPPVPAAHLGRKLCGYA